MSIHMAQLATLPVEVILLIFESIKSEYAQWQWQLQFLEIMRCSRFLYEAALPFLYVAPQTSTIASSLQLLQSLRDDPWKAELVTEMSINYITTMCLKNEAMSGKATHPPLLPNCVKLSVGNTQGTGMIELDAVMRWAARCPKLEELTIHRLTKLGFSDVGPWIHQRPESLRALRLTSPELHQSEWDTLWSLCHPWLKSLYLNHPTTIGKNYFGYDVTFMHALLQVQILGPCLEDLTCTSVGGDGAQNDIIMETLQERLPNLKTLKCDSTALTRMLAHLGHANLEELRVQVPYDPEVKKVFLMMLRTAVENERLPALRRVVFLNVGCQKECEQMNRDLEKCGLERACGAEGIELEYPIDTYLD